MQKSTPSSESEFLLVEVRPNGTVVWGPDLPTDSRERVRRALSQEFIGGDRATTEELGRWYRNQLDRLDRPDDPWARPEAQRRLSALSKEQEAHLKRWAGME